MPVVVYICYNVDESRGSPNIEMDEHTFLVNRERAVDYLNSLEKVRNYTLFSSKGTGSMP